MLSTKMRRSRALLALAAPMLVALFVGCSAHGSGLTPNAALLSPAALQNPATKLWTGRALITFQEGPQGGTPQAGLTGDDAGNLYGTTVFGGNQTCVLGFDAGCGVVFKVSRSGTETVLHRFTGTDGEIPVADLLLDRAGNIYGTTEYGGSQSCNDGFHTGCGTIFKLRKNGKFSVLYNFSSGLQSGAAPLCRDRKSTRLNSSH